MTDPPVISIVMSIKNGMPFLPETLKSIQAQTLTDWELLAVDNASTDGSIECLQTASVDDSRIRVLLNETDLGMSGGLNRGLQEARAEWIARMDADDLMYPERLERQLTFLRENPEVKVSCCRAEYINEQGRTLGKTPASLFTRQQFEERRQRLDAIGLLHPGVIMHRPTVLAAGGYRGDFWPAEDIDLWNRLAEQGHLILVQDEVLMAYRLHDKSSISQGFRQGRLRYEWVRACMRARRSGLPEPTWEGFLSDWNSAPLWKKLNRWRKLEAKALYRMAGQDKISNRHCRCGIRLLSALLLQPAYVCGKLKSQFVT